MEKEQTQVEQELKVNPDLEEKMDTPKLNNTLKPSSETNINTVNFIQAILAKDDLSKKKILKTFLVLLSLCIAIYYYFAVSTAQNITSGGTKIILTVVLTLFMGGYLFVDALGVWVGSKILGGKGKFVDTFIVTLSIAMLYFTNEVIHYILELAIGSIIATIIKFILWICILIFSIKTLSKVQEFSGTRSFLSIILSGILIYVWTLFFFFIVVFLIMLIFGLSLIGTF